MRVAARFLTLLFVSYGPLAPIMLLYLLAMPPLIALIPALTPDSSDLLMGIPQGLGSPPCFVAEP